MFPFPRELMDISEKQQVEFFFFMLIGKRNLLSTPLRNMGKSFLYLSLFVKKSTKRKVEPDYEKKKMFPCAEILLLSVTTCKILSSSKGCNLRFCFQKRLYKVIHIKN